jgi:ribosome-binding protein aMBF1 (putative translation factor)
MKVDGVLSKEGKLWLVEIPILNALTQGHTRKEALSMAADWVRTMAGQDDLEVAIHPARGNRFEIESDPAVLVALILRRRREASGLSLSDVSTRLGSRSRNAYARYERGSAVPTVAKLDELMQAVGGELVIRDAASEYGAASRTRRKASR